LNDSVGLALRRFHARHFIARRAPASIIENNVNFRSAELRREFVAALAKS
jgi:hypothetical protein